MQTEIEAKFLHINIATMRTILLNTGATCKQPMQLMRRVVYDNDVMRTKNAFLRIRDEGHRITMTYKQYDDMSLTGAKEIEFNVSDYEAAIALTEAIGIKVKCEQEARRELWTLGNVEIMIDEWPWIDPFVEIEGPTKKHVQHAAKSLGFSWRDAVFGDIMTPYRAEYPATASNDLVYNLPAIRFEDPLPAILRR